MVELSHIMAHIMTFLSSIYLLFGIYYFWRPLEIYLSTLSSQLSLVIA